MDNADRSGAAGGLQGQMLSGQQKTQELIEELMKVEKKQSGLLRIMLILNVILTAGILTAVLVLVPQTVNMVNSAQESLVNIDQIVEGANTILEDADRMVMNANQIMQDNSAEVEKALDNFNIVDFETLNRAINDLADAVKPLAGLSHLFG